MDTKQKPRIMAATQGPVRGAAFAEKVTKAAWKTKPSWYLVADNDKMIYPDLQREFAKKLNATTTTLKTSHVPFISKPKDTAAVIMAAVNKVASPITTLTEAATPAGATKPTPPPHTKPLPPPEPTAKADIPLSAGVRRYYAPGVTHGGGKGGFPTEPGPQARSFLT